MSAAAPATNAAALPGPRWYAYSASGYVDKMLTPGANRSQELDAAAPCYACDADTVIAHCSNSACGGYTTKPRSQTA
eukprot:356427-Chlamydomonas_euryale.AAC.5